MGLSNAARSGARTRAGFSEIDYGGHNQIVKYDGIMNNNWLLEASFARAQNKISEMPSVDEWSVTDQTVTPNVRSGGLGFYEVGNEGKNLQYSVKSTHIYGNHQIRTGILFEDISYDNTIDRTGPSFTLHNGEQTVTGATLRILPATDLPSGRIYRVVRANTSQVRETTQEYFSFFLQDTIQVGNRLTIRPGVRYEQQKHVGNLESFKWSGNWAPRVGGTFDLTGDGRAKLYANFGRFYAKIPNDLAARALSADAGVTRADYFDAALTQPIVDGVVAAGTTTHFRTAGQGTADFDPDSGSTYLNETLVGAEFEAFPRLILGIRYTHRNFGRILEDVGTAPLVSYFLGIPGLDSVEYFITNPGPGTPVVAAAPGYDIQFDQAIHDYDAVEFTADKRFSDNWSLQGSYRWSRLHGTFEGFFRNDNGQSDPSITSLFDFPNNDPSYTGIGVPEFGFKGDISYLGDAGAGPLPNDRPHQIKLFGNYTFNNGLNIGLGIVSSSGGPLTTMAANPAYDNAGEIPEGPRGSGVQTADGFKTRSPFSTDMNMHADYVFDMGGNRFELIADVFNLFDTQTVLDYDYYSDVNFSVDNPDFGNRIQYQAPRQVRLGLRFRF